MSVTILHLRVVKARKTHRCNDCGAVAVHPGHTYTRQTNVYDGRIYDWVSCADCDALLSEVWEWCGWPDHGVGSDEFHEWATEHQDDPEWGERASAFLARAGADDV